MDIQKLHYLFNDFGKLVAWIVLVLIFGLGLYLFFTRDNDIYGRLPTPYLQNALTRKTIWEASGFTLDSADQEVVFKVKNRRISRQEAWVLASSLKLPSAGTITLDEEKNEHFYSKNSTAELSVDLASGGVHYKNSASVGPGLVNKSQATDEAKKFVKTLGVNLNDYNLKKPSYDFLQATADSAHLIEVGENKANIIYVSFNREIDSLPVVTIGGSDSLSVGLDSRNQIISLNYSKLEVEPQTDARYKLFSEGNAKSRLLKGEGKLNRYLIDPQEAIANPGMIRIGKGQVYFYNDKTTSFIQPIFVFQAQAQSGSTLEPVEIYLPALKSNYFKKQ